MAPAADICAVLSRWPAAAVDSRVAGVEPGFSGASVSQVTSAAGAFALRCWPTGDSGLPRDRIVELHRWLASLAAADITTVAVPLPTCDGSTVVDVHGRLWQLERWLPGTADFHVHPTDSRLIAVLTELARWHRASERYEPTTAGAQWFRCSRGVPPAVTERLEKLRTLGAAARQEPRPPEAARQEPRPPGVGEARRVWPETGMEEQTELAQRLAVQLAALAPRIAVEVSACTSLRVPLHPCLRDVWHDHVLFDGDAVTGIIDPSAARTENVASDLSRLLGSLLGDAVERWEIALDAYAQVRALSDDERRLVRVLDRSGVVLSGAYWLKRILRGPLGEREWQRVGRIAERVEALACTV